MTNCCEPICNRCCSTNLAVAEGMLRCGDCGAAVSVHKHNGAPMGKLADGRTGRARGKAHSVFDKIWRDGLMSRTEAYAWLSEATGIAPELCHFGEMNLRDLELATLVSQEFLDTGYKIAMRRKAKNEQKQKRRLERELRVQAFVDGPRDAARVAQRRRSKARSQGGF